MPINVPTDHGRRKGGGQKEPIKLNIQNNSMTKDRLEESRKLFEQMDTVKDNQLAYGEFRRGFVKLSGESFSEDTVKALFNVFDGNKNGYVNVSEWTQALGRTLAVSKKDQQQTNEELFMTTCKVILKIRQRKHLRNELDDFTEDMISREEFAILMNERYNFKLSECDLTMLFNYFDVDRTRNISLANVEHFICQFPDCEKDLQSLEDVMKRAIKACKAWEEDENMNPEEKRESYSNICTEMYSYSVFGMILEPLIVIAYFLNMFATTPKGDDIMEFEAFWFAGLARCFITFGFWFYSFRVEKFEGIPGWLSKSFILVGLWATLWVALSLVYYAEFSYTGMTYDCYACNQCNKKGSNYYDPICYGDITAFAGQDDTCVCGISRDSQSGLDSPERKQSCSVGWDCFDHSTCEDIYNSVTPGVQKNVQVNLPQDRVGYIDSEYLTSEWSFQVMVTTADIAGGATYELSQMQLQDIEDSTSTSGTKTCFYYKDGFFFKSGTMIIVGNVLSFLFLTPRLYTGIKEICA